MILDNPVESNYEAYSIKIPELEKILHCNYDESISMELYPTLLDIDQVASGLSSESEKERDRAIRLNETPHSFLSNYILSMKYGIHRFRYEQHDMDPPPEQRDESYEIKWPKRLNSEVDIQILYIPETLDEESEIRTRIVFDRNEYNRAVDKEWADRGLAKGFLKISDLSKSIGMKIQTTFDDTKGMDISPNSISIEDKKLSDIKGVKKHPSPKRGGIERIQNDLLEITDLGKRLIDINPQILLIDLNEKLDEI